MSFCLFRCLMHTNAYLEIFTEWMCVRVCSIIKTLPSWNWNRHYLRHLWIVLNGLSKSIVLWPYIQIKYLKMRVSPIVSGRMCTNFELTVGSFLVIAERLKVTSDYGTRCRSWKETKIHVQAIQTSPCFACEWHTFKVWNINDIDCHSIESIDIESRIHRQRYLKSAHSLTPNNNTPFLFHCHFLLRGNW